MFLMHSTIILYKKGIVFAESIFLKLVSSGIIVLWKTIIPGHDYKDYSDKIQFPEDLKKYNKYPSNMTWLIPFFSWVPCLAQIEVFFRYNSFNNFFEYLPNDILLTIWVCFNLIEYHSYSGILSNSTNTKVDFWPCLDATLSHRQ